MSDEVGRRLDVDQINNCGVTDRAAGVEKPAVAQSRASAKLARASSTLLCTDFYRVTLRYSAVLHVGVCPVHPTVRHKPVLYRNDWTNRAGFWHEGASFHLFRTVL